MFLWSPRYGGDRDQDAGFLHSNEPEKSMKVEP